MKKTLYNILSPEWYYSTRNRERIHPDDLDRECSLVEA